MSDLRQQIRDHYEAKSLSAGKVEAILARGRGGEKVVGFPVRARALLALAATVVLAAGLAIWWPHGPGRVSFAVLAPRVVEFFGKPPELPKLSQNPEELRAWLLAQGAPADFQIPSKLRGLESLGCKVVDVHGRQAWLTCFWREKKPDGTGGELVHLWVVKRGDFKNGPGTATPQMHEESGWSFASWSQGDIIYTLATKAPMEKLRPFAARSLRAMRHEHLAIGRSRLEGEGPPAVVVSGFVAEGEDDLVRAFFERDIHDALAKGRMVAEVDGWRSIHPEDGAIIPRDPDLCGEVAVHV